MNSPDGAHCVCNVGYKNSSGGDCIDIDECSPNPCKGNSTCVNMPGYFLCVCEEGFDKVGQLCISKLTSLLVVIKAAKIICKEMICLHRGGFGIFVSALA